MENIIKLLQYFEGKYPPMELSTMGVAYSHTLSMCKDTPEALTLTLYMEDRVVCVYLLIDKLLSTDMDQVISEIESKLAGV